MKRSPLPIGARVRCRLTGRLGVVRRWWRPWAQVRVEWDNGASTSCDTAQLVQIQDLAPLDKPATER